MVRFIDNFSVGHRGSISAEKLLEQGYLVIFLHRKFGLLPFARQFEDNILNYVDVENDQLKIREDLKEKMKNCLLNYKKYKAENKLYEIAFTSVGDYLYLLEEICLKLKKYGKQAMVYLAAAVSDFYIPLEKMVL